MTELSEDQWKSLLKSTKFFKIFKDEELDNIIGFSHLLHFAMHKYIIKENEKDLSFYVIVKGHANVITKSGRGDDSVLLQIDAGDCFGEMAIITGKPRKNFIIAGSDCYVVKINLEAMDSLDMPIQLKLYKQFAIILTERIQKSNH